MKKAFHLTLLVILLNYSALAQWSNNGNNLTTTDKVGIGTSSPNYPFELKINQNARTRAAIINQSTGASQEASLMISSSGIGLDLLTYGSGVTKSLSGFPRAKSAFLRTHTGNPADRLVIATGSAAPIHFSIKDQPKLTIGSNGFLGLGTTKPTYAFELNINQNARTRAAIINQSTGASQESSLMILSSGVGLDLLTYGSGVTGSLSGFPRAKGAFLRTHTGSPADRFVIATGSAAPIHFATQDNVKMTIHTNGSVGIGTTNSSTKYKLMVNGAIRSKEVKVEANWSDFVFYDDYDLRTLEEVENYISKNRHLPDIPSETEVAENGINIGEMNAKLLQKIEELTLYTIEQEKQLKSQESKFEKQQEEIEELKALVKQLLKNKN